jgi:capsular polysaccharide biosynthesis protein
MPLKVDRASDQWYESEESTRVGMIEELQRIRRRTLSKPLPVLLVAALVTGAITYKLATRGQKFEAEIVLALTEGSLSAKHNGLPVDELRQFVDGVLIPDKKLAAMIERRNLYPIRRKAGMEYALEQLREQLDVQIWKNSFVYYDEDAERAEHSARIGLTVSDSDPDRAFEIAHDISAIVIQTAQEHRQVINNRLALDIGAMRDGLTKRLDQLALAAAEKQSALATAHKKKNEDLAQALALELGEIDHERKNAEQTLGNIAVSRDALADRIAAAGLDTSIAIVEETRPDRPDHRIFVLLMIAVVVGVGSLAGSALVLGAFDSRIHETDDVSRLGLPVLGHVPGFAGDHVGTLAARGVPLKRGGRVGSSKWRSHQ